MGARETYAEALRDAEDPEAYLMKHSGLPGPRGNLELADAAADVMPAEMLRRWAAIGPDEAGTNEPRGYLAMCGVIGLGRLAAEGEPSVTEELRAHASDPRWRVREAVASALQRLGDADPAALARVADAWASGGPLERRAAVAAVAEPRLLRDPAAAAGAVALLDRVTASYALDTEGRRSDGSKALRKALGYAWSVVIVADRAGGEPAFERWLGVDDRDIRWICRENLRKTRLARMDEEWVAGCLATLDRAGGST